MVDESGGWGKRRAQLNGALEQATDRVSGLPDKLKKPTGPSATATVPAIENLIIAPGGGSGEISITWDAMPAEITHYEIFRGDESGGPYVHVAIVTNRPAAWWPDERRGIQDVDQFEERYYVVRAIGDSGQHGPLSDEASGSHIFRPSRFS